MKKALAYIGVLAAIAVVWLIIRDIVSVEGIDRPLIETDGAAAPDAIEERYSSEALGLSFAFPGRYDLTEKDLSSGHRNRHSLVLIEDGYVPPQDGEGPTAVTIDVFQNDLDGYTASGFATGASDSNWKLGPGALTPRTVGGEEGVEYTWSGLYEGRSVVVARPDYVYMFSVTRMGEDDPILEAFDRVLETVEFAR